MPLATRLPAVLSAALAAGCAPSDRADWKDGAVCYEIFVRSFADSDGDGVGDLNGLTQRLDYVVDLGARCLWLMPVAPSPSYHGYDVTDYYGIEPDYGTADDFRRLVREAHARGIRVLIDLVLNHLSSAHPYFQDALQNPASPYRDWFMWSPSHPGVRNRWGGDNWHRSPVRDEYYYGFFWSGMPDLNYRTPAVREEAKRIAEFWLEEMDVDGFRLDAVKHLVEEGQGRIVEHVPLTHEVLRDFAAHVKSVAPGAFTIGEVWDTIGALLPYYPDQLDAYFAFEASDAIIEAVRTGTAIPLLDPFLRLQGELPAGRWAPFLRNHDQARTGTALDGDLTRARLAATLLLTLPGLPFVYYGEEIGMTGDKPDERIRTPMHWTRTPAAGFTTGTPWQPLQPDSFTANVAAQENDPGSLLNLYRRLIRLRADHPALAGGRLVPLGTDSDAVAAYLRRTDDRAVLVVANLGGVALSGVTLLSGENALPAGRHEASDLFGGQQARPLTVRPDGRVDGYVPLASLEPRQAYVFDLRLPRMTAADDFQGHGSDQRVSIYRTDR